MEISNAYYIKLGKGGEWESDSFAEGVLRVGWEHNDLRDINERNWPRIAEQLRTAQVHSAVATRDENALRQIVESDLSDVWITFSAACLWWCRLSGPMEEDGKSKFRRTVNGWTDRDAQGRRLTIADIPGKVSKVQGFRGTVCSVPTKELWRLLKGEGSPAHAALERAAEVLAKEVSTAIQSLHWKDFETLVDLLFRSSGWRRLGISGGTMKYADLELEEPVTRERYQVQVKSTAGASQFREYRNDFGGRGFRKLYFVVHTPLADLTPDLATESAELILPDRLGPMIVKAGLVDWVLAKIR